MAEVICICGKYDEECDRKCAGAVAQQQECEREGHLTPENMTIKGDHQPGAFGFCFRCGWKSPKRVAYEEHHARVIARGRR